MSNSEESLLRKKEWDNRFKRDANGMASLAWKVSFENEKVIEYKSRHINYDLHILFPDDLEVINSLGKLVQVNFENGIVKVFIEKWKKGSVLQ